MDPRTYRNIWTTQEEDELRRHWLAGFAAAEIGRKMRRSKNSVIGKANRMRLPPRAGGPAEAGALAVRRAG